MSFIFKGDLIIPLFLLTILKELYFSEEVCHFEYTTMKKSGYDFLLLTYHFGYFTV